MLSTKEVSIAVDEEPGSRASASVRRRSKTFAALCLAVASISACSAGDTARNTKAPNDDQESNNDSTVSKGSVRLGQPYLSGTCTPDAAAFNMSDDQQFVTVGFSNQQYAGDRNSPDYVKERTEGRLIGDAKSTAPKCVLHVPMKVTAGYQLSPTNIVLHGFAHRGFVFGAYRWANSTNPGFTFERQVPPDDTDPSGKEFSYKEQLYTLWSPTCTQSGSADVDAELIVTIEPYTATGTSDTIVAIDSFSVAGLGALEKCDSPKSYNQVAQEGESCGIVDMDYIHFVRCDTSKQTNICVYSTTNKDTGTCVNRSKSLAAEDLGVGYDDDCGGPFYKYCSGSEPLVCEFVSGDARQNASNHYGRCVRPLAVGAECKKELYGACDGRNCDTTIDPCQSGSKCTNGKCK